MSDILILSFVVLLRTRISSMEEGNIEEDKYSKGIYKASILWFQI